LKNAFKSIMNNVADYKSVAEVCHTASEGVWEQWTSHTWERWDNRCTRNHDEGLQNQELGLRLCTIVIFCLYLIIEYQSILILLCEPTNYTYEVSMVDRGSNPHASKSQSEMKWYVVIVKALENYHGSKLFATEVKHNKKTVFESFRVQVFSFFLSNSSSNQSLLRIFILRR
jgi:hypothetical protein